MATFRTIKKPRHVTTAKSQQLLKQLLNASGQELCNCSSKVIKNTQKWWKLALLALGPNKGTKVFGGMPPSPPYRY